MSPKRVAPASPSTEAPAERRREFLRAAAAIGASLVVGDAVANDRDGRHPKNDKHDKDGGLRPKRRSFTTGDGATLSYLDIGWGQPIVMMPGWSQTANEFQFQFPLANRYRLIVVDPRAHGESSKVTYGQTMHRYGKDIRELIHHLDLRDVVLLGHSMGCSAIWGYWELYEGHRIDKLVLVDQSPCLLANPKWDPNGDEYLDAGPLFSDQNPIWNFINPLTSSPAESLAFRTGLVEGDNVFFTANFPNMVKVVGGRARRIGDWVLEENLKFPDQQAADAFLSHFTNDWRDIIKRIDVSTLVVGAEKSIFTPRSQRWVAAQVRHNRGVAEIFAENEGGSHFMFMENPEKFNHLVRDFVG